jgi:hypothetical protein
MEAAQKVNVIPMVVRETTNPLDDSAPTKREWFVADGVCGFAWVVIRPANCAFAKWMKANKGCRLAYGGGIQYWVSFFNQSMQLKEAYADAWAAVVKEFGIHAYSTSRMD